MVELAVHQLAWSSGHEAQHPRRSTREQGGASPARRRPRENHGRLPERTCGSCGIRVAAARYWLVIA
eukprot:5780224-Heterocapsa_arctica.AAC.1